MIVQKLLIINPTEQQNRFRRTDWSSSQNHLLLQQSEDSYQAQNCTSEVSLRQRIFVQRIGYLTSWKVSSNKWWWILYTKSIKDYQWKWFVRWNIRVYLLLQ